MKTHELEYWRQDDPRLNEAEAWPKTDFPDAEYTYFRECGCLVCALAVLLRHHGLEDNAEDAFDPWLLNRRLIACGAFTSGADLELEEIRKLYPLIYAGATPYTREALVRLAENGSPCLITVPGIRADRHFTALLCLTPDDAVVFDPLCGERKLSEYARVCEIRAFRRTDQKIL
ncbi:MAG: hypothetical protein K6F56_10265 [Oscillospiraceae bacterium]|nr:hypothetical protein [Oscillospiraceae bacterium]